MARRPSKHTRPVRPLGSIAETRSVERADGRWLARPVTSSEKVYRCPGCQQLIAAGLPHVVAWPDALHSTAPTGVDERRHWHTGCWQRGR